MNFKIKTIAAAVALALSGAAAATPIGPEGIFFTAWNGNSAQPSSIIINLGMTADTFLANPTAAFSLTGGSASTLSSWLGGVADTSLVKWSVTGAMLGDYGSPSYGVLSTSINAEQPGQEGNWGHFTGLDEAVNQYEIFLVTTNVNDNLASTDAYAANTINQLFLIGQTEQQANVGTSMSFYQLFADQNGSELNEGDLIKHGTWSLDFSAGQASLAYSASAVPLPAAAWMLISGVLGLAGIARRKSV